MYHPYKSAITQSITHHDDIVEVARLANKIPLLIRALGGLLPGLSSEQLPRLTTALEIACGPGGWTREMARAHPQMHITGVDSSPAMITFARSMLRNQDLANVKYLEIPTFVDPYPFNDASFDLISVQFISKFLIADDWPRFLSICRQLLRPGGLLRLTEFEVGFANSLAHEKLSQLFIHAMRLAGRSFSPSDRHLGLLCELEPLLCAANFQDCFGVAHTINYSYGAPLHEEWKRDFLILSRDVQSFIIQMGVASQEQIDALHQQQHYEMHIPTFHAIFPLLTMWGVKRETAHF